MGLFSRTKKPAGAALEPPPKAAQPAAYHGATPTQVKYNFGIPTTYAERLDWKPVQKSGGGAQPVETSGRLIAVPTRWIDRLAYLTAIALAATAAWFSVNGMVVLFPGAAMSVIVMGIVLETAKIVTAAWLASRAKTIWPLKPVLFVFMVGLMVANAAGVFGQLVVAHLGERMAGAAAFETQDADKANKIEVATAKVQDLDRRISQIDNAITEATRRGRTNNAMKTAQEQRRTRDALSAERQRAAEELATLKTGRTAGGAQRKVAEAETAPITYAAALFGINRDPETLTRWLIALLVACFDPLAVCLVAAVSGRRRATR